MKRLQPRLIFLLVLLVLVFTFALQNVAIVEVQFLFWGFELPRSLLIFIVLAIGVAVGWFLRGAMSRRRQ